jgi:hypothetical protein
VHGSLFRGEPGGEQNDRRYAHRPY